MSQATTRMPAASRDIPASGRSGVARAADGLPIVYREYGSGPTLLLLHGWSCRQDFWDRQIEALAAGHHVVTLDLPGHGASPAGKEDRAWSMEAFGGDVVAVADAVGARDLVLVGHSMGGAVAVEAALALGPRCRLLLGVDTFNEAAFYAARPAAEIAGRCTRFRSDYSGTMAGMIGAITAPGIDPAIVEAIAAGMADIDVDVSLAVLEALLAWDIKAKWPDLAVPAVTINSALLAERNELLDLPRLEIQLMEGVGHFPMLEDPEAFNALALAILARHLGS